MFRPSFSKTLYAQIIVHPDKLVAEFYSSATPSHTLAKASTENAGKGKKGAEDLTVQRSLVRTAPGMVDSCWHATNRPYLTNIISFFVHRTYRLNPAILVKSYQEEGLSSGQVAKKLGISKSTVIKKLQGFGVSLRPKKGSTTVENNYRHHNPPYGYSVKKGVLAPNPREVKVCRWIVNLIRDKGMGYSEVARELGKKQIKNRKDKAKWSHSTIKNIFDRHKNNF